MQKSKIEHENFRAHLLAKTGNFLPLPNSPTSKYRVFSVSSPKISGFFSLK